LAGYASNSPAAVGPYLAANSRRSSIRASALVVVSLLTYEDPGGVTKDDAQTIGAELRQQIVDAAATNKVQDAILAKRLAELDRDRGGR
jgi:hypothetical protein